MADTHGAIALGEPIARCGSQISVAGHVVRCQLPVGHTDPHTAQGAVPVESGPSLTYAIVWEYL